MREILAIVCHHQCLDMNLPALHEQRQAVGAHSCVGHAIVANQRKCRHKYLTGIAGVGQTLRIAHHRGIENHLAHGVSFVAERPARELRSIFEYQFCCSHHYFFLVSFGMVYNVVLHALMNDMNSGCGWSTVDEYSGWNCVPMYQRFSGISTISTRSAAGFTPTHFMPAVSYSSL